VIIWDALLPDLVSPKARKAVEKANREDGIFICDVSLWEIAALVRRGRIAVDVPRLEFIRTVLASNRATVCAIDPRIAELAVSLPEEIGPDPADRLIAATSIVHKAWLVTADERLRSAKCLRTLW
jgi:PIN domain nuclease of toxin-antitoxin system